MKKNLFKVLFGVLVFFVGVNVHAEVSNSKENMENGVGSDTQTVTVGEVAAPVYNVNFYWNDLTFDWVYDEEAEEFGWAPASLCEGFVTGSYVKENFAEQLADGKIYSDDTCSTRVYESNIEDENEYYVLYERDAAYINIEDYSTNGQIVPTVEWKANADYDYVEAEFAYFNETCVLVPNEKVYNVATKYGIYSNSTCSTKAVDNGFEENKYYTLVEGNAVVTGGEIPDSARRSAAGGIDEVDGYIFVNHAYAKNNYSLRLNLKNKTTPTITPTAGSAIGTITISVRAK